MISLGAIAVGMLLMIVNGLLNAGMVILAKLLQQSDWPYFRLFAITSVVIAMCLAVAILRASLALPSMHQAKWVAFRGMFGAGAFVLMIFAVQAGAAPGDAAAFSSINTIFAALMGRVFLGERLECAHGISVLCSFAGAILISKPSFLFATSDTSSGTRWLGYMLAAASGLITACSFISARKSSKVSMLYLNISPACFCALSATVIPLLPFIDDGTLDQAVRLPGAAAGIVVAHFLMQFGALTTNSAGSTRCPAAVSATTNTGSKMFFSYGAQALLFGKTPELLTLLGAALMFLAVVIMAIARLPGRQPAAAQNEDAQSAHASGSAGNTICIAEEEDAEGLASFIAAEFVERMPNERPSQVARVRRAVVPEPAIVPIGMAISSVVASA